MSDAATPPAPPEGTTELGIDIVKVERIERALEKHGRRFPQRILTEAEDAYVRDRPENLAGRWAAKEAVSKVLGLGVRGVGWREIEIVRLPTGQPTVRLHDRALRRAGQLGMERIAVSISHEREYAVAIAYGVRRAGGTFVFPLDVEARLDDRERSILRRMERLRAMDREASAAETSAGAARPATGAASTSATTSRGTEREPETTPTDDARSGRPGPAAASPERDAGDPGRAER